MAINLHGELIYLRAPEQRDSDVLYRWENNTAIWQVSNTYTPYSQFVLEQYLLSVDLDFYTTKQLRLMVCDKSHLAVGCVDLFEFEPHHGRCGIGIMIDELHQQKGYADDAVKTIINYCFQVLCLNQVYCNIGADNFRSLALFEKNGFHKIGLKKMWNKVAKNRFQDEWTLQLLND